MSYRRVVIERFGGPEVLQVVREPTLPEPGPGEVRIRVLAAGVSFTDTLIRRGAYPDVKADPPITPGYDVVGEVDQLGPGVSRFEIGQRVAELMTIGGYSEYVCLTADRLVSIPDEIDPAEAVSLILSAVTAHQLLHRKADVQPGQRILVHGGAGAVGSLLLQLGVVAGLEMYATGSTSKQDLIARSGATPIDYAQEDFIERIAQLTDGGVDAVFESVSMSNANRSFRALRPGGTLVIYGLSAMDPGSIAGKARIAVGGLRLALRRIASRGRSFTGYSIAPLRRQRADWFDADLTALVGLVLDGRLQPPIDARISLDEIAHAHERIEAGEVTGRIVIDMTLVDMTAR